MFTALATSLVSAPLLESAAFRVWVASLVILFLKMFANSVVQALGRVRSGAFTRAEDARVFAKGAAPVERELPLVERASGCWRNDLENIPMYLFISLAFVLAGGGERYAWIYFGLYTLIRCVHTIVYLRGLQPHRFLAFSAGNVVLFCLLVHLLLQVFG